VYFSYYFAVSWLDAEGLNTEVGTNK